MNDHSARGRPLDPDEMRALQGIERDLRDEDPEFPQRLLSQPGVWHPPVRQTGTPLSVRLVIVVLGGALVFAGLIYLVLPEQLIVPVVLVTLLGLLPAGCLIWARRSGEL